MTDTICESLLEMHFHQAIVGHFAKVFGAKFLKLIKPSARQEVWVGFDQAWVRTTKTRDEVLRELRDAIQNQNSARSSFYLGYYMQFKRVEKMVRRSKYTPLAWPEPCLRAELDLEVNSQTGLSQHQTLVALNHVPNARVAYACPMMFDLDEIYDMPNLKRLRMVNVATAPNTFKAGERHFIAFRHKTDTALAWLSEPTQAESTGFEEWATPPNGPPKLSGSEILELITVASSAIAEASRERIYRAINTLVHYVPECFTLLEFASNSGDRTQA